MDKLAAHKAPGYLHRAFSVVIFDEDDRVLIHRRADSKYHFGGLWSNTCCSHPGPGEELLVSARRRLRFEMGLDADSLRQVGQFEYRAVDPNSGLVEHELDYVIVGTTADDPNPNPNEASAFDWVDHLELRQDVAQNHNRYTPWLPMVLDVVHSNRAG